MSADERLAALGLTLPSPPRPIGNYVPFRLAGNLLFLSGVGPRRADETTMPGREVPGSKGPRDTSRGDTRGPKPR